MFRIEVIGNIGGDAEIKNDNGRQYVQFSIADTRRFRKEDGTEVETTNWISCFYRNTDSSVIQYLKKGTRVFVRGNGETRLFSSAKDRMMKAGVSINVSEIELVGGGSSDVVPRELVLPTGQIVEVHKFYAIDVSNMASVPQLVYDKRGLSYSVSNGGWITPIPQQQQQQTETQQQQTGAQLQQPVQQQQQLAQQQQQQQQNINVNKAVNADGAPEFPF